MHDHTSEPTTHERLLERLQRQVSRNKPADLDTAFSRIFTQELEAFRHQRRQSPVPPREQVREEVRLLRDKLLARRKVVRGHGVESVLSRLSAVVLPCKHAQPNTDVRTSDQNGAPTNGNSFITISNLLSAPTAQEGRRRSQLVLPKLRQNGAPKSRAKSSTDVCKASRTFVGDTARRTRAQFLDGLIRDCEVSETSMRKNLASANRTMVLTSGLADVYKGVSEKLADLDTVTPKMIEYMYYAKRTEDDNSKKEVERLSWEGSRYWARAVSSGKHRSRSLQNYFRSRPVKTRSARNKP